MKKKLLLFFCIPLIFFTYWYFGTMIYPAFLFTGKSPKELGKASLINWLYLNDYNNPDFIKEYWPNDTVLFMSKLRIINFRYRNLHIINTNNGKSHLIPTKNRLASLNLLYKESQSYKYNPFQYNFEIHFQDLYGKRYDTSTIHIKDSSYSRIQKHCKEWRIGYFNRKLSWHLDWSTLSGNWPLKNIEIKGIYFVSA